MTADKQFTIQWIDHGREARNPPDPKYPKGIDLDLSHGMPHCATLLPYPAPRVGMHYVVCNKCGQSTLITAAGRVDDPRSVKFACKFQVQ